MKGGRRCAPSRAQLLGREPERATTMRLRFLAPLSRNRLKRFPSKLPKNGRRPQAESNEVAERNCWPGKPPPLAGMGAVAAFSSQAAHAVPPPPVTVQRGPMFMGRWWPWPSLL